MAKAGGIVALIAGIFGVIAAGFTLSVGGIGSALNAESAQRVVLVGWSGVLFSFLAIVLGAMAIGRPTSKLGWSLIVCSVLGMIFGGFLVSIFMLLSLVGGVLGLIGEKVSSAAVLGSVLAATPVTSTSASAKVAEMSRLSRLKAEGKISDDEFSRLKSDLLQGRGATGASDARAPEAGDDSPLLLKTPLKQPVQMNFADIPKLEKLKADGLLSDEECARLVGGIVSRYHHSLSIDDLPVLGKLYANGSLTEEQFSSAKSAIIASSS